MRLSKLVLIAQPEKNKHWQVGSIHGVDFILQDHHIQDLQDVKQVVAVNQINNSSFTDFQHVVPVFNNGIALAYVLIEKGSGQTLDKEGFQFIETLTNIVVVAIENQKLFKQQLGQERFKREMELAGEIQRMLIPTKLPTQEGINMTSMYQPHAEVGGDYFDVFEINSREIVFCIGDISGKGISAALLMSNFQANLRALVYQETDLVELIKKLNDRFTKITNGERFITFFIAKYDKVNSNIDYISCGHNPTYIASSKGIQSLKTGCTLLGMFDELPSIELDLDNNSEKDNISENTNIRNKNETSDDNQDENSINNIQNLEITSQEKENINTENKNVVKMENFNQDNISEIIEKPVSKPKKGYFVQLASFNNETKAKVSVDILNEKLAVSLSGNELQIMRVDLGDGKGIWWRIVTNTMPRGEAETVCALLKSEGNNCIVRSK